MATTESNGGVRKQARGISSRDHLLAVATELFIKQGYAATTIDQIGEAANLTGPAIYRHFKGKADIFVAVLYRTVEGMVVDNQARLEGLPPEQVLAELVDLWVDASLDGRQVLSLYEHEHHTLDAETLDAVRKGRAQFRQPWIDVMRQVRPALSNAEAITMVEGIFWMLSSPAFYRTELTRDQLRRRLKAMVLGALLAHEEPAKKKPARARRS